MKNSIVSERPPYASELVNCIARYPMEGKHNVAIHITDARSIELLPGEHTWTHVNETSEYHFSNVVFTNISYKVIEADDESFYLMYPFVVKRSPFCSWLYALVFGSPDIQVVVMSFSVRVSTS